MVIQITIPKNYWLDVNKFDYTTFDYDDIRLIYNSPRTLIEDFEKITGFKQHVTMIYKNHKSRCKKSNIEKKNK